MPGASSKNELRNFFLKTRSELTKSTVEEKSLKILQRFIQTREFQEAEVIHSYISIKKNNEVDTFALIHECFEMGKKVVVPKIAGEGMMDHIELTSIHHLKKNNWGVPEPKSGKQVPVTGLDLVIVPMVAGDQFKNRLGYGKGFYDRFLVQSPEKKIGFLFDCQLYENKLPVESFDIPLDILITESKLIA